MTDINALADRYAQLMTSVFNLKVTLTVNADGTVTRVKSKGVKPMTLTSTELAAHIAKMDATLLKLLAL